MATVADRFPTPCTSTFWTPDCERHTDMRNNSANRRGVNVPRLNETSSEQTPPSIPAGESLAAHSDKTHTPEGMVVYPCAGSNVHEEKLPMPTSLREPGSGVSVETRRRYNAISEGIFISSVSTPTSDSPSRGTRKTSTASAASTPQQARLKHKTQSRTTPVAPGGTDRGGDRILKRSAKEISRKQAGPGQERGTQRCSSSRPPFTNGGVQGACATNVGSRERSTSSNSPEKQRDSGRWIGRVLESGLLTGDGGFDEEVRHHSRFLASVTCFLGHVFSAVKRASVLFRVCLHTHIFVHRRVSCFGVHVRGEASSTRNLQWTLYVLDPTCALRASTKREGLHDDLGLTRTLHCESTVDP